MDIGNTHACPKEADFCLEQSAITSCALLQCHSNQGRFCNIVGGVISPTLANMVLDGLEHKLKINIRKRMSNGRVAYHPKINLIRYADDFVVTGDSPETLAMVKELVVEFLTERGLELSPEKTRIVELSEGFNFLGQNVRLYGDKVLIKPSKEAQAKIYDKLRDIVRRSSRSSSVT